MALIIAGLGIKFLSHLTKEIEVVLRKSEKVLYLTNDQFYPKWIEKINKNAESLDSMYFSEDIRVKAYSAIKRKILEDLTYFKNLCVVIYGNPNFFVQITSMVSESAKRLGYDVHILPGVSALDCMLADLCINPGDSGMHIFEATELLVHDRIIDVSSHVVIFQVASIGQDGHDRNKKVMSLGLKILLDYLSKYYFQHHEIVFYEASQYPGISHKTTKTLLKDAYNAEICSKTSIYIPPIENRIINADMISKIRAISADFNASSKKLSI